MQRNIIISLLWVALPFLVLVIRLGYFQLPVADDLIYQKAFDENGIWGGVQLLRDEWNTRWMSMLALGVFFKLIPDQWLGLSFQVTTLILGFSAFLVFIRRYTSVSSIAAMASSIYLCAILFLSTFGKADSWFWLCSTVTYVWPSLVSIFLFVMVFSKWDWKAILPIIASSAFVGGGSEVIAISVLTTLIAIKVFEGRLPEFSNGLWLLGTVALTITVCYGLFGKGAQVRLDALPENTVGQKLIIGLKAYVSMLFLGIPKKLLVLAMATISLSFLLKLRRPRPSMIAILGIADTVLIVTFLVLGLAMSEMGPKRTWFYVMLMMTVLTVFISMHLRPNGLRKKALLNLALIGNGFIGIYVWNVVKIELPRAAEYHAAVIDRTEFIESEISKGNTTIELTPLPEPGMMYWAEISSDPASPENLQLSLIYGENIDFVLTENPPVSD